MLVLEWLCYPKHPQSRDDVMLCRPWAVFTPEQCRSAPALELQAGAQFSPPKWSPECSSAPRFQVTLSGWLWNEFLQQGSHGSDSSTLFLQEKCAAKLKVAKCWVCQMIAKLAEINFLTQFEVLESRHSLFVQDTVDLYSVCGARLYNRGFIH